MNRKNKETDLKSIRKIAKMFLYTDILETDVPFVAAHPFTPYWFGIIPKVATNHFAINCSIMFSPENGIADLRNATDAAKWRKGMEKIIEQRDLLGIFFLLNKPYILNFLKHTEPYMSNEDLGKVLTEFWQFIEQISLDKSVSGRKIVSWFSRIDKNAFMNEEEKAFFDTIPDMVTVYRGVTSYNKRKKKALSWSTKRSVAEWFANRFSTGTGEVWTITVPKERILYYFNGREEEVIVNLYGFDGEIQSVPHPDREEK